MKALDIKNTMKLASISRHVQALLWGAACAGPALAQTGFLNDTGQTLCDNGSNVMVACTSANTGDTATYKRQDGRFGRDVASPAKVGGGVAGFDFTRLCWNGDAEGSGTCTGPVVANTTDTPSATPSTDWACTKDNVTGLVWSLQSLSATWTQATTPGYPDAGHNTPARCGFANGWRLPTRMELIGLELMDGRNPSIDANYFPGTQSLYWSSDTASTNGYPWSVSFNTVGLTGGVDNPSTTLLVRLVRSVP
ncbi:hypothetical protein GCM10028785_34880 [Hydrogenophaga soli]